MSEEFLCIQEVPTCRNRAGRSEARVELRVLRQRAEPGTSPDLLAAVSLGSTGQDWGSLREKVIGFSCRDFASYPDVVPVPILGPSLLFCGKPACWIRGSNPQDKVKPLPPSPPCWQGLQRCSPKVAVAVTRSLDGHLFAFLSGHAFSMSENGNSSANLRRNKITRLKRDCHKPPSLYLAPSM